MHSFSFPGRERLKSARSISILFERGKVLYSKPVRVIWQMIPNSASPPVMVAFSVSKKNFKRAVDRNLLKRRMRESYRKNKYILDGISENKDFSLHLLFIYAKPDLLSYKEVENGIIAVLMKLKELVKSVKI